MVDVDTMAFPASCIDARVEKLQQANGYWAEFVSLYEHEDGQEAKGLVSWSESQKPGNCDKNRFCNILPYDHSRVILRGSWPHDYINASYIRPDPEGMFEGCQKSYIAAQGCLSSTTSDFWYMIWQENSRLIVCMTKEFEDNYRKCAHYWPDPGEVKQLQGGLTCTHLKETLHTEDGFTLREFRLVKDGRTNEARIVSQFHFNGWPDHGVPKSPGTLLHFIWHANERRRQQSAEHANNSTVDIGPIVVHCSGGIGRTGTFIVLDLIVGEIRRNGLDTPIDVRRTIQMLRTQRGGLVETRDQYQFVHLAISQHVSTMMQRMQVYQECLANGRQYTNIAFPNQSMSRLAIDQAESLMKP